MTEYETGLKHIKSQHAYKLPQTWFIGYLCNPVLTCYWRCDWPCWKYYLQQWQHRQNVTTNYWVCCLLQTGTCLSVCAEPHINIIRSSLFYLISFDCIDCELPAWLIYWNQLNLTVERVPSNLVVAVEALTNSLGTRCCEGVLWKWMWVKSWWLEQNEMPSVDVVRVSKFRLLWRSFCWSPFCSYRINYIYIGHVFASQLL